MRCFVFVRWPAALAIYLVTGCGDISVKQECTTASDCVDVVKPIDACQVPDCDAGTCELVPAPDGTACDDGNSGTGDDMCKAGVCTGTACPCFTDDDCCDGCLPIRQGQVCPDDGVDCTSDLCDAGSCVHEPKANYCIIEERCFADGEDNPDNQCQRCNFPASQHVWTNKANGVSCDDQDLCSGTSTCSGGVCQGADFVGCAPLDACHVAGSCDPASGACDDPTANDGEPCDDADLCTQTDTCQAGVCTGSDAVSCPEFNPDVAPPHHLCYAAGVCNPMSGDCEFAVLADGTSCDDGDAETGGDACLGGKCLGGGCTCLDETPPDLEDPCCADCVAVVGSDGSPCLADNLACTNDECNALGECDHPIQPGFCVISNTCYTAGTENPSNQCLQCDPSQSATSWSNKIDGTTCSDANACTQTDTCQAGSCVGTNPVTCAASDTCHEAGTCDPTSGICSNPPKTDGTECNDGDACTKTDTCQSGTCVGGNLVLCTASDQCHDIGVCDPSTGICSNPQKVNGTPCNDGNQCTDGDSCQDGACSSGPWKALGTPCNDGASCTTNDRCHKCYIGVPKPGATGYISCKGDSICSGESCDSGKEYRCDTSTGTCACLFSFTLTQCYDS